MDTKVVIFMIGCATAIALASIICDYLFEKKIGGINECFMSKKIIKIHRNYIAGFLGFAVIMLLTAKYGGYGNAIFAYLSFGSTITSLVLSILAIFVTVQSSSDLYKQFTRIDNATDTIKNVSTQIDGTLAELKITESNLQETAQIISSQLDSIVEKIGDKTRAVVKETEGNISRKLEEVSFGKSFENESKQITPKGEQLKEIKERIKSITSARGLLALYACALSKEKDKPFILSNLFKGSEAYTYGYLISALSYGVILFVTNENTNDSTNDNTIDDKNIKCIESIFTSNELFKAAKDKEIKFGNNYSNMIDEIKQFFDN